MQILMKIKKNIMPKMKNKTIRKTCKIKIIKTKASMKSINIKVIAF